MSAAPAAAPLSIPRLLDRSPGPASYNYPSSFGAKKGAHLYSFSGKIRVRDHSDGPGPGKYAPPTAATTLGGSKPSFGHKPRTHTEKDTGPGPGAYGAANVKASTLGGPRVSFGMRYREPRAVAENKATPAPGQYEVIRALNKAAPATPAFSITGKVRIRQKDSSEPGPGAYNVSDKRPIGKGAPAYSVSGKRRETKHNDENPGPGSYSVLSTRLPGPSFSMSRRLRNGISQGYWAQDGTGPTGVVSKSFMGN